MFYCDKPKQQGKIDESQNAIQRRENHGTRVYAVSHARQPDCGALHVCRMHAAVLIFFAQQLKIFQRNFYLRNHRLSNMFKVRLLRITNISNLSFSQKELDK